jgi:hypothetical protein
MPWVTFGCRGSAGMPVGIGLNMKDENYFAHQSLSRGANSLPGRAIGKECLQLEAAKRRRIELKGSSLPLIHHKTYRVKNYCLVPVKVPSPNCPSETLPLIVLPSVLPEYFTARLPAWPSTLYSIVTSSPFTVPVT